MRISPQIPAYPPSVPPAFDAARNAVDLSLPGRGGLIEAAGGAPAGGASFLNQLATLLRAGVVGVETRIRDGQPVERFVEIAMADDRLRGTRHARPGEIQGRRIDLRA